jgi:predicted component of type VI protein secretion system
MYLPEFYGFPNKHLITRITVMKINPFHYQQQYVYHSDLSQYVSDRTVHRARPLKWGLFTLASNFDCLFDGV